MFLIQTKPCILFIIISFLKRFPCYQSRHFLCIIFSKKIYFLRYAFLENDEKKTLVQMIWKESLLTTDSCNFSNESLLQVIISM